MSVQGLVLYCDGGNYRSNNAPGGGGLHGYFYTVGEPDKKNKIKKYKATNLGYIDEGLSSEQITENMSREHFIAAMQSTERYEINITSYCVFKFFCSRFKFLISDFEINVKSF